MNDKISKYLSVTDMNKVLTNIEENKVKQAEWISSIYIIGSLANTEKIQSFADKLIDLCKEFEQYGLPKTKINDSWTSHGPDPDVHYLEFVRRRGMSYAEAMDHPVANSVYSLDKSFLDDAELVILYGPAGKSAYLELGYAIGTNKETVVIKNWENDRVDVMEGMASHIFDTENHFIKSLAMSIYKYCTLKALNEIIE
jgi:hypothetical protein